MVWCRSVKLEGIHHVTCVTADAPSNADFYVRVMGLRIVKKTINQTDQTTYHIFYGDERASYGNNISFFEYRGRPDGRAGAGNVHRSCGASAARTALDFWERRLADEGVDAERAETALRFADHEGLDARARRRRRPATRRWSARRRTSRPSTRCRASTACTPSRATPTRASAFLTDALGFGRSARHRFEAAARMRGGWYQIDPAPPEKRRFGGGVVQHVAWGCRSEDIEPWQRARRRRWPRRRPR